MTLSKLLPAVLISGCLSAEPPLGIIGGEAPFAALVSSTGELTDITVGTGFINSVAINAPGTISMFGGRTNGPIRSLIALHYGPETYGGPFTITVTPDSANTSVFAVALNLSGQGLAGGINSGSGAPYAVTVSSAGIATPIALGFASGQINSVAINDSAQGLLGGRNVSSVTAYAAFVSPSGIASSNLVALPGGTINSVAINALGNGIIGGTASAAPTPYAALVSPTGGLTPLMTSIASGSILSVAINGSNQAIIGGNNIVGPAYAAFVSPSGVTNEIPLGLLAVNGSITGVAINDTGQAIIGGQDGPLGSGPAYAAFVSPSGGVTFIATGITNGLIDSVAINGFGQGLIGGRNDTTSKAYAAIVSPFGVVTPLAAVGTTILSVAMSQLPVRIPTDSLSGNSLRFANYINKNAPQDVFYFIPAMFDGTLAEALKSAAPTRNAISLYTASNNVFYLNNRLSDHLRDASRFRSRSSPSNLATGMTASLAEPMKPPPTEPSRPYTLWLDGLGALSEQKAQKQTVGFDPKTGAVILGFDAVINPKSWAGLGAAYSYTHVHEKHHAGHSNINQEYLFIYGSYEGSRFYIDGALWGGAFQTDQVRRIRMTGFEFNPHSHPKGWQLTPHLELGSAYKDHIITLDPFVMIDWVNSWQHHYKETGGGPMNAGQKEHYSSLVRAEVGARFYQTISSSTWRLSFQEKGSYVYKHPFQVGQMHAFLVGSPGTFTVETLTTSQNLGVVEVGMIVEPINLRHPYGIISYQIEFGSSFKSQQISLEIAWNF